MLSRIAIGTANWCNKYGVADTKCSDIEEILGFCQCNGIDTIDTAVAYGDCLKQVNSYFNVVTKIRKDDELDENRNYYAILAHDVNELDDEMLDRLTMYKCRDICEKVGVSLYLTKDIEKTYGLDLVQVPYSVFDRRFEPYFEKWKKEGVEIHTRSVFLQGVVFSPEKLFAIMADKLIPKINTIKNIGNLSFLLLIFALLNTNIDKIVMGVDSLETLKKNLSIFQILNSLEIKDEKILLPYNWS